LQAVRGAGDDLTAWLEYAAEGLELTLDRVWKRIRKYETRSAAPKLVLRPRQEQFLQFLRDRGPLRPAELWEALGVSRQGLLLLARPLVEAGLVEREGTRKSGCYRLARHALTAHTEDHQP
jgi:predicted HTH transcriptional regulator